MRVTPVKKKESEAATLSKPKEKIILQLRRRNTGAEEAPESWFEDTYKGPTGEKRMSLYVVDWMHKYVCIQVLYVVTLLDWKKKLSEYRILTS